MATYGRVIQSDTITVRRGNAVEIVFRFKDENGSDMDLTGKAIVFRGRYGATVIRKSTADDLSMATPTNGEVTLPLTEVETRSIPSGKSMRFEFENFTDQVTLGEGFLVAAGGVNDD